MSSNNNIIIQDNFLSIEHFQLLNIILTQYDFFWAWNSILYQEDFIPNEKYNRQLVHWFYPKKGPFKDYYEVTGPFLSIMQGFFFKIFAITTEVSL